MFVMSVSLVLVVRGTFTSFLPSNVSFLGVLDQHNYQNGNSYLQGWKLKPKPKPENPVLKEILETQSETDTY